MRVVAMDKKMIAIVAGYKILIMVLFLGNVILQGSNTGNAT